MAAGRGWYGRAPSACVALLCACTGALEPQPGGLEDLTGDAPGSPIAGDPKLVSGRTGPRRLTNYEYDNTVRDLLGSKLSLASKFVAEEADGFDYSASAAGKPLRDLYYTILNGYFGLNVDGFGVSLTGQKNQLISELL